MKGGVFTHFFLGESHNDIMSSLILAIHILPLFDMHTHTFNRGEIYEFFLFSYLNLLLAVVGPFFRHLYANIHEGPFSENGNIWIRFLIKIDMRMSVVDTCGKSAKKSKLNIKLPLLK